MSDDAMDARAELAAIEAVVRLSASCEDPDAEALLDWVQAAERRGDFGTFRVARERMDQIGRQLVASEAVRDELRKLFDGVAARLSIVLAERDEALARLAECRSQLCEGEETLTDAVTRVFRERDEARLLAGSVRYLAREQLAVRGLDSADAVTQAVMHVPPSWMPKQFHPEFGRLLMLLAEDTERVDDDGLRRVAVGLRKKAEKERDAVLAALDEEVRRRGVAEAERDEARRIAVCLRDAAQCLSAFGIEETASEQDAARLKALAEAAEAVPWQYDEETPET